MSYIFGDSFDYYTALATKWSDGKTALIDLSGANSRTGIGCCLCFPFGPELNIPPRSNAVIGDAYKTQTLDGDIHGLISGTGVFRQRQVRTRVNADGSVSVCTGNDPGRITLGTSAPNVISANIYHYVETKVSAFAVNGTVTVRVDGVVVLTVTGNTNPDATGTYVTFYIGGPGGGLNGYHDDIYLLDLSDSGIPGSPNNDFLGAIRQFAQPPIADGSPLDWTPSVPGPHFPLVAEIPPDGGATNVKSGNPSDVDQYVYGTAGIVAPVQIFGVQVCITAAIDIAGSRTIAPNVGGHVGTSAGLTTSQNQVKQCYDGNPVDGSAWELSDFNSVQFGPEVTG